MICLKVAERATIFLRQQLSLQLQRSKIGGFEGGAKRTAERSLASLLSELLHSRGAPRAAAASTGRRISQYRGHFLPVQHRGRSD